MFNPRDSIGLGWGPGNPSFKSFPSVANIRFVDYYQKAVRAGSNL